MALRIGRSLQFLGLLILPFAIASELVGEVRSRPIDAGRRGGSRCLLRGLSWFRTAPELRDVDRAARDADCVFSEQIAMNRLRPRLRFL